MNFLKWISFGTWDVPIMPNDYNAVQTLVSIFLVLLVAKLFFLLILVDVPKMKNTYAAWIMVGLRLLHGFIYLLLLSILGLFHSPGAYFFLIPVFILFIVEGIMVISGDMDREYVWPHNKLLKEWAKSLGTGISTGKELNKQCINVNKKIYDYLGKALIK